MANQVSLPPCGVVGAAALRPLPLLSWGRFFYQFLLGHERSVAKEVRDEYLETMSKIYLSYFKSYTSRLMKVQVSAAGGGGGACSGPFWGCPSNSPTPFLSKPWGSGKSASGLSLSCSTRRWLRRTISWELKTRPRKISSQGGAEGGMGQASPAAEICPRKVAS